MQRQDQPNTRVCPFGHAPRTVQSATLNQLAVAFGSNAFGADGPEAYLTSPSRRCFVAYDTSPPDFLGCWCTCVCRGSGGGTPPRAWITDVLVNPKHRGKGYGRCLLRLAEAGCWEAGHDQAFVWCDSDAVGFYKRLGYVPVPSETCNVRGPDGRAVNVLVRRRGP